MPRARKPFRRAYRIGRSRTGLGCFATQEIPKGQLIDTYRGQLLSNEEAEKRDNRYMFEVNSRWTIDGSNRRNLARYFNHSCRPNAESDVKGHKVIITARRKIKPGEEITYDYGKDYFDIFLKPVGCKCDKCREKRAAQRAEARAKKLRAARRAAAAAARAVTQAPRVELRAAAADKKPQVKRGKVGATRPNGKKATRARKRK
ncbi:SET domain-containing protein [Pseudorhodoplanes sp.]|uniref:SET domain-containing protein n=1 Tax=Pseudorhodoplanes sp. TaxID=1934341 RepID=UPI00391A191E